MTRNIILNILNDLYYEATDQRIEIDENMSVRGNCYTTNSSSLELMMWFISIEDYFKIEISEDIIYIRDIVDRIMKYMENKDGEL